MSPPIAPKPSRQRAEPRLRGIQLPSSKVKRPPEPRSDRAAKAEKAIVCAVCNAPITSIDQAVRVNDRHEHAFFNPAGIAFEIRCFRQAPGVVSQGDPRAEFTWFPGYHWQVVLCGTCHTHLGWLFRHLVEGTSFFGLIVHRLA